MADRIKFWREYRGLSITDVAAAVGVKWPSAYGWEVYGSTPTHPHFELLCKVFGITMEQFYGPLPKRRARA